MTAFNLVLALFLVFLNGFFVAAEFALVKVRATQLQARAEKGNATARLALHASHHLDAYLSATQLGITLASIGLGWVGEPAVAALLEPLLHQLKLSKGLTEGISFGVAFTMVSVFHIVLGELAPKSWAIQRSETLTLLIVRPLHFFYIVFRPVIVAMNKLAALTLKPFGIDAASGHETAHSEEELRMLVKASGQSGVLNETEVEIAGHVLGFADKTVIDVMVPRVDVLVLDANRPVSENIERALASPFSRYPLVDGDHDEVLGVVHIKELFALAMRGGEDMRSICREALHVPVTKPLDQMLRDFQQERAHMAIVLDEYGGLAGVITLENVIEEIVGDIADESDPAGGEIHQISDREWLVAGRVRIDKANESLNLNWESDEHDTVAGYVFERIGRIPKAGETIHVEDTEVRVEEVDGRRVQRLRVRKSKPAVL